jgi:hypothetical protein
MPRTAIWSFAVPAALLVIAGFNYLIEGAGAQSVPKAYLAGGCDTPQTPFCDALMAPIPNWTGHVFHFSQNYPTAVGPDVQPWLQFDPTTQPDQYLNAVLNYFFEGNIHADTESSFDPTLNAVRGWYNAPWQDVGINGREFIHGLTRERVSRLHELAPQQVHEWNNYAVGFYNAPGGMIIGRVWQDHGNPDPTAALFPNGTVAAKLIFTTASEAEVPYLKGAPQWQAYIYANPNDPAPKTTSPRAVLSLRLLQIDIAVKDDRVSETTGWVFGTFVYGGGPGSQGASGWTNVSSVGVMWGNDPGYSGAGSLTQTWLNPAVHMPHVGYQGRLNGPIDNPASSCLSCHSTAEVPSGTMVPPSGVNSAPWFRNVKSGMPFDSGRQSADYSLQLSVGIANFIANHGSSLALATPEQRLQQLRSLEALDEQPPRAGGSIH